MTTAKIQANKKGESSTPKHTLTHVISEESLTVYYLRPVAAKIFQILGRLSHGPTLGAERSNTRYRNRTRPEDAVSPVLDHVGNAHSASTRFHCTSTQLTVRPSPSTIPENLDRLGRSPQGRYQALPDPRKESDYAESYPSVLRGNKRQGGSRGASSSDVDFGYRVVVEYLQLPRVCQQSLSCVPSDSFSWRGLSHPHLQYEDANPHQMEGSWIWGFSRASVLA